MKSNFLKIFIFTILGFGIANAYTSPTDAYRATIEYSTKVNSSKFSYESKEEGLNEVYAKLYPQLEGSVGYARTDYTRNDMAGRKGDPRSQESTRELSLTLSQVIYDPTLMTAIDVEKSRIKYFYYGHELEKQKVATEALDIYMTVLNIKNKIDLLKANLSYVEQNQKMIEEKYSMSLVTKMDYLKVNVEAQKSRIDLLKEEKNYDAMFTKLLDVTKLESIVIPDINLDSITENFIKSILNTLEKNSSLDNNLEILQARTAILLSANEVDNAKSGHLPDLSMNASYTKYISKDETTDYDNYGRAMVKLRIPIFQGGAVSSRIENKKLMKKSAEEEYRSIEDDVKVRLKENINLLKSEIATLSMYKDALISGETYLESVQLAYDKGLRSIVELFDAQNKLFEIKYDYIKSIHEMSNLFVKFIILTNNLEELSLIDNLVYKEEKK